MTDTKVNDLINEYLDSSPGSPKMAEVIGELIREKLKEDPRPELLEFIQKYRDRLKNPKD